jgi:hypothetical protein
MWHVRGTDNPAEPQGSAQRDIYASELDPGPALRVAFRNPPGRFGGRVRSPTSVGLLLLWAYQVAGRVINPVAVWICAGNWLEARAPLRTCLKKVGLQLRSARLRLSTGWGLISPTGRLSSS